MKTKTSKKKKKKHLKGLSRDFLEKYLKSTFKNMVAGKTYSRCY